MNSGFIRGCDDMTTLESRSVELETQGYTILESFIDPKITEETAKEITAEYRSARPLQWRGGGKWFGHINYVPSFSSPIFRQTANSELVKEILDDALGTDYKIVGFGGNANLPGSRFQPCHADGWMGTDFVVVNIPLGKVTEENGSTEIWPGTHKQKLTISEFNSIPRRSVRLNSSPGDIVIRYSNLWHRGTPNRSTEVRLMLAFLVSRCYDKLPPISVTEEQARELMKLKLPVNFKTGANFKTGFKPNYFPATFKGNILELSWMYAPAVFTAIRHFKKSSI